MVQVGRDPVDSKAIAAVGRGAREIRVRDEAGAFRVIWVASFGDVVYVLHAFQKKTPRTSRSALGLAARRYRQARALAEAEGIMREKVTESSGNIFLDLGLPPHEAAVMLLRAELAEALRKWMERKTLTQTQAAKRLGVNQPRISEIVRGKVELLSLDYLVGLCAKAGLPVKVRLAA